MDSLLLLIFSHMSCCNTFAASQQSASGSVRVQSELAALAEILRPPPLPLSESGFLLTPSTTCPSSCHCFQRGFFFVVPHRCQPFALAGFSAWHTYLTQLPIASWLSPFSPTDPARKDHLSEVVPDLPLSLCTCLPPCT